MTRLEGTEEVKLDLKKDDFMYFEPNYGIYVKF